MLAALRSRPAPFTLRSCVSPFRSPALRRFVTGLLIGACIVGNPATLSARMSQRPAHVLPEPPPCDDLTAYPQDQRYFVETQCTFEHQAFADDETPSIGYRLEEAPTRPGKYEATDAYGRTLKLEVVHSVSLNLRGNERNSFNESDEGYMVTGWLSGSAGRIPVQMVTLHKPSLTPTEPELQAGFIVSIVSDAVVAQASQAERISAGARVVNSSTGQSVPLASASAFMSLYSFPSDLSTLYGVEVPPQEPHADKDCIELAYKRYGVAMKYAEKAMAMCVARAMAEFAGCVAGATFLLYNPIAPLGVAGFTAAMLACLGRQIWNMSACLSTYNQGIEQAAENLQLDLEGCGVHISQT